MATSTARAPGRPSNVDAQGRPSGAAWLIDRAASLVDPDTSPTDGDRAASSVDVGGSALVRVARRRSLATCGGL
jgi:hypothetical protein